MSKMTKLMVREHRRIVFILGIGKDCFYTGHNMQIIKEKTDILAFIKIKFVCSLKDLV